MGEPIYDCIDAFGDPCDHCLAGKEFTKLKADQKRLVEVVKRLANEGENLDFRLVDDSVDWCLIKEARALLEELEGSGDADV